MRLQQEIATYAKSRYPFRAPQEYWKVADQLPLLQSCARVLLSVPVSSAAVERLFSEAGMILSKLRKKTRPKVLQAMMYLKYSDIFKNIMKDIEVDPEEVKEYLDAVGDNDVESSDEDK